MALISPFPAVYPVLNGIKDAEDFLKSTKMGFTTMLKAGRYRQEASPVYYLHRIQTPYRSYTGFVSYLNVSEYINKNVRKHENTIRHKEEIVGAMYKDRQGLIKPILLTYPNVLEIDALTNRLTFSLKPAYEFNYGNGEHHTFWRIDHPEYIEQYTNAFQNKVPVSYIADGHHRAQSSEQLYYNSKAANPNHNGTETYNWVLTAMFPASELEIHNYNRILLNLNNVPKDIFFARLSENFVVEQIDKSYKPPTPHHLGMYFGRKWYRLSVKQEYLDKHPNISDRLDVAVFNDAILNKILGIAEVRDFTGIEYLEGPKGTPALTRKVDTGEAVAAFNLYPVALEDMIVIADQDGVLPPKSTWFFPRLRNGCIAQLF